MDAHDLAHEFDTHRSHLHAVAVRMLGSHAEADDAVQEAWLRLDRTASDPGRAEVDNLGGWLTTVVARICLDHLRSRTSRREAAFPEELDEVPADPAHAPEHEAVLADSVGLALLVVLDTLAPAERLAFVLHDLFGMPFEEIAPVVDRTQAAARQLASRARRRVRGSSTSPDRARQREVVMAFLAASREGDFASLLALLDPDAVLRLDPTVLAMGGMTELHGREAVAAGLNGKARAVRLAVIDGYPGGAWVHGGVPQVLFDFRVEDGLVVSIDLLGDPEVLAGIDLELLRRNGEPLSVTSGRIDADAGAGGAGATGDDDREHA